MRGRERQIQSNSCNPHPPEAKYVQVGEHNKFFLRSRLFNGWGIEHPESIMRIADGWHTRSRSYRVDSRGQSFFLRETHDCPDMHALANECMLFCEANGVRVQHLIPTREGSTFYGKNHLSSLSPFSHFRYFDGSMEGLRETAGCLAELDRALLVFPGGGAVRENGTRFWHKSKTIKHLIEQITSRGERDEFDCAVRKNLQYVMDRSLAHAPEIAFNLPNQAIHSNLHAQNVIFSAQPGRLLAFLNFESLTHSQRIREVAFAMHRFARACAKEEGADPKETMRVRAREFLSAYNAANPLTDEEAGAIGIILAEENLRRALKVLRLHYLERDSSRDEEFAERMELLKESEMFDFL